MAFVTGTDAGETLNGVSDAGDTMNGLGGDDTLNGKSGDDTIYAGDGNDVVNAQNGSDTVYGGAGNDLIHGQKGDDTLFGEDGNDVIDGGMGADGITGGAGDDLLTGGEGGGKDISKADTFNYSFNVQAGQPETVSFSSWSGLGGLNLACATQSEFSTKYTAWLNHLVASYDLGKDLNGDGKIEVSLNQNDPNGTPSIEGMTAQELDAMFNDSHEITVKTGKTTQTRYYSDDFTFGTRTSVTSADGHDTITDFHQGEDQLNFAGITPEQFNDYFTVGLVDADQDGQVDDTLITLNDDSSWSLTLIDVAGLNAAQDIFFA